jgi:hypothetical protein
MTNSNPTPTSAQRTATFIGLSLALGATLYAAVAWFLHSSGAGPTATDNGFGSLLLYIWIGFMTVSCFASLFIWRSRVEPLISGDEPLPANRMTDLLSAHMICLALIEAACLFGVTVFLLSGIAWPALAAVLLIWFVFFSTRPQPEWFERFR